MSRFMILFMVLLGAMSVAADEKVSEKTEASNAPKNVKGQTAPIQPVQAVAYQEGTTQKKSYY